MLQQPNNHIPVNKKPFRVLLLILITTSLLMLPTTAIAQEPDLSPIGKDDTTNITNENVTLVNQAREFFSSDFGGIVYNFLRVAGIGLLLFFFLKKGYASIQGQGGGGIGQFFKGMIIPAFASLMLIQPIWIIAVLSVAIEFLRVIANAILDLLGVS